LIILIYLLVGSVAGLTAGLFGVGGGLVIVPALVFCFTVLGFSADTLTQMAVGTSLATIVVTSISSVRAHQLLGNVRWRLFWLLTPGIIVGVLLGANTAANTAGPLLQLLFGVFAVSMALQMGLNIRPPASRDLPGRAALGFVGSVVGFVSALFGIGGGSLTVPFLSWCNVRMQETVGTAAACGLPIAIAGALANTYIGWGREQLPEYSTGFVYWPAFFGIVLTSAVFAKLGATLAQRLPPLVLKRCFAAFLLLVGSQFILRNL
jgi:uncharacterized membrane protein YfcA